MLKKFSVTNYRQFNETLEFDLTASNYSFNQECVKNNLVKLALIYGKNGISLVIILIILMPSQSLLLNFYQL